jgi:hypothetical protein
MDARRKMQSRLEARHIHCYMPQIMSKILFTALIGCFLATQLIASEQKSTRQIVISVPDQKLVVLENSTPIATFPVSTSRFGVGDRHGSYRTPLGELEVAQKIGDGAPLGSVFRARSRTGEIVQPNASGRDAILTRILWLRGLESGNEDAYERGIYIHGTPVEKLIGKKASYGCIRMKSADILQVFAAAPVGTRVSIVTESARSAVKEIAKANPPAPLAPVAEGPAKAIASATPATNSPAQKVATAPAPKPARTSVFEFGQQTFASSDSSETASSSDRWSALMKESYATSLTSPAASHLH